MSTPDPASATPGPPAEVLGRLPAPPSERGAWIAAGVLTLVCLAVLVAIISGVVGRTVTLAPPAVPAVVATPAPAQAGKAASTAPAAGATAPAIVSPAAAGAPISGARLLGASETTIATSWMEGFYPIYGEAQRTFGVNWLLIASIHMQETAFSTAPSTYRGLNFAHCCGGPMQFNVTNGRVTTWDLVSNSYIYARRPARYDHMTARHPSIYDDFDAIMAGAHLLSADGAGYQLDASAWNAAYDYYGHDANGVAYADEVLARAIGWSQHGFCINCGVQQSLIEAVHAAYGAPVLAGLQAQALSTGSTRARAARSARPR